MILLLSFAFQELFKKTTPELSSSSNHLFHGCTFFTRFLAILKIEVFFSSLSIGLEIKMENIFFFRSEAWRPPLTAHVTRNLGGHAWRPSCGELAVSLRAESIANIESNVIIRVHGLTTVPQLFSYGSMISEIRSPVKRFFIIILNVYAI